MGCSAQIFNTKYCLFNQGITHKIHFLHVKMHFNMQFLDFGVMPWVQNQARSGLKMSFDMQFLDFHFQGRTQIMSFDMQFLHFNMQFLHFWHANSGFLLFKFPADLCAFPIENSRFAAAGRIQNRPASRAACSSKSDHERALKPQKNP